MSYIIYLLAAVQIFREIAARSGRDLSWRLCSADVAESMRANPAYQENDAAHSGLLALEKGNVLR